MESRKAWRTRDASANDEVLALIEALRDGVGAERIALFDDDRGDVLGNAGCIAFWEAFGEPRCAAVDWPSWYRALRTDARVCVTCGCPAPHRVDGYLIHGRWALLLMGPATAPPGDAALVASALRALADRLPPCRSHAEAPRAEREREDEQSRSREDHRGTAGSAGPASGPPLFWMRKRPEPTS